MNFPALAAAIALSASLLSVVPASAQDAAEIAFHDLDLASPEGGARFDRRVDHAIDMVCHRPGRRSPAAMSAFQDCANDARAQVQAEISRRGIAR